MKLCRKCHTVKEIVFFNKDKKSPDGRRYACSDCENSAKSAWYRRHKEGVPDRKPCEFCGLPTNAEGNVCSKCGNEALKMFGDRINYHSETLLERRAAEINRIKDSLKCVCSVETRVRMKRVLAQMEADNVQAQEVAHGNGQGSHGEGGLAVRGG